MSGEALVAGRGDPVVTVSVAPLVGVLSLLLDAARGRGVGSAAPPADRPRELARDVARGADPAVLRVLAAPAPARLPDALLPVAPVRDVPAEEHLAALDDVTPEALCTGLAAVFGDTPPPHWRQALREPARWLDAYRRTLRAAWTEYAPVWRRSRPALGRDIERVAVAVARRRQCRVLTELGERSPVSACFPGAPGARTGGRDVALVPMPGVRAGLVRGPGTPDAAWLGYPVRTDRARGDALGVVLGEHRAAILRQLDEPCNAGTLAQSTYFAPSTLNYHCNLLVAAELITRDRHGREVRLSRTDRGTELLCVLG